VARRGAARLVERTDNVYVELSTSFPDLTVVREAAIAKLPDAHLAGVADIDAGAERQVD